jgi:hypothetical protein
VEFSEARWPHRSYAPTFRERGFSEVHE